MPNKINYLLIIIISGCASSPYPLADQDRFNKVYSAVASEAAKCNADNISKCQFISVTSDKINELANYYTTESVNRDRATIASGEGTFYGAIAALAGSLSGASGLLNTGIGITAFSSAAGSHYNTKEQALVFSDASEIARCYNRNINELGDQGLFLLLGNSADDSPALARETMQIVQSRLIKLQAGVNSGLRAVLMPGYTVDQLAALVVKATPTVISQDDLAINSKDVIRAMSSLGLTKKEEYSESLAQKISIAKALPARLDLCSTTTVKG